MLARKVLDLAEEQGLLDGKAIAELRKQLGETKFIVTPEAIAKVLVDHGHLTAFQARKLVSQALGPEQEAPQRPAPSIKRVPPQKKPLPETIDMTFADEEPGPSDEEIIDLEAADPQPEPVARGPSWKTDATLPAAGRTTEPAAPLPDLVPLEELPGDPLGRPGGGFAAADAHLPRAPRAAAKNVWDSPLLLVGGGVLGVVLVVFAVLLFALTRGTAAQVLLKADEAYRSGAYTSAIAGYDAFLKAYPKNPEVSKARVFRGLAELRQVADDGKDPVRALATAKSVLPQIEREEQFPQARPELSAILPGIADGLATAAVKVNETGKKEDLVKQTGDALALVNNPAYLPTSLRKDREPRIAAILDKLKLAERTIAQEKEFAAALAQIEAAAANGDAATAYHVQRQLLRTYPGLAQAGALLAAIQKVGEAERQLVRASQPGQAALTDDPPQPVETVVLAARSAPGAADAAQPAPLFVLLEGGAYGLDAGTGRVLWRRPLGYESAHPPLTLAGEQGDDALLVDARRQEILRLRGITGELLWRQPLREPAFAPTSEGQRVLVATRGGRVIQLDAASGKILREAQLPQGASASPAVEARSGQPALVFQLGEHSTLFVLDGESLECTQTFYLGHKRGSILVPPTVLQSHVLICESPGDDHTLLRVLAADPASKRLANRSRALRLKGRVVSPPAVSGRRIAVMTDLGQIAVYELDPANGAEPLRLVAGIEASETAPLVPHFVLSGSRLWTATRRRTLLEVQTALQQFARRWSEDQGDWFVAPMQLVGDKLVYFRRNADAATILAEACNAASGEVLWTTHLAAPIVALAAAADGARADALTAEGWLFAIAAQQVRGVNEQPLFEPPTAGGPPILPLAAITADGSLVWAESGPGGRVLVHRPGAGSPPVATSLPAGAEAAAAPQVIGGNLLVPLTNGSVVLLEPGSGKLVAEPFVPALVPGELPQWTRPAVRADGSFLISDGRQAVYSVALQSGSPARLAAAAQAATAGPVLGLETIGGAVLGVLRGGQSDQIVGYGDTTAAAFEPVPLLGRVTAGPYVVGGLALVAAEPDGLVCVTVAGQRRWQQPLAHGPLAGSPLATESGELIVRYQSGEVARIDATTGNELAVTTTGQPLGPAACLAGDHLLTAGSDGTVHRLPLPARP